MHLLSVEQQCENGGGARTVREKVSICEEDGKGEGITEMTKLCFDFKK